MFARTVSLLHCVGAGGGVEGGHNVQTHLGVLDLCQVFQNIMINCSRMTGLYDLKSGDLEFSQPGNPFRCFKDRLCCPTQTGIIPENSLHMVR